MEEPLEGVGAGGPEAVAADARPLPQGRGGSAVGPWAGDARTLAIVAAGGLAAGAATVAAVSVARTRATARMRRPRRRGREREGILASRSFLVDVHVLDR